MSAEEIGAVKVGPLFGRVVAGSVGQFGWFTVLFDRETPDDDCWWTLTKPDARHSIVHTKVPCWLGADMGPVVPSGQIVPIAFYGKPTAAPNTRGILESPILIQVPDSKLIGGIFAWDDRILVAPSFAWVKK